MTVKYEVSGGFFGRYQELVRDVVIPYQEKALLDEIPDAEKSHAVENFRQAAQMLREGHCDGAFYGMVFQDSDVAKWLEAAAYSLGAHPDEALAARCDAIIDLIGQAQHPDGYLNTYFTVKEPERRWTNLQEAHELYCAGHMIEAAVAYAQETGKTKLLDIMRCMADHMYTRFVEENVPGYPGHPEVELALMRLYHATGDARYMELARCFIDRRGTDYFAKEAATRGWTLWNMSAEDREYAQNVAPVREAQDAVGHAVRAVYLYTGMAALAVQTGDETLIKACRRMWGSLTERRMYVTGAIGSCYEGEALTKDYHLPNDTAYAETCAAIGLIFFGRQMLQLEKDGRYADEMERALYNCVLAGMQLDGRRFFYVNPLEVVPGVSGEAAPLRHALPQRPKWYGCACCPPNVARLVGSIGQYAAQAEGSVLYSHLYVSGRVQGGDALGGDVEVETAYPDEGAVRYRFCPKGDEMRMTLAVRLPAWSRETRLLLNGQPAECRVERGYAYLERAFTAQDCVELCLDMTPRCVYAANDVAADNGRVAFMRGPLVYCAEGVDNGGAVLDLRARMDAVPEALAFDPQLLCGCAPMEVDGWRVAPTEGLYSARRPARTPCRIRLVPYYTWGNRGLTQMRVWMPEM